MGMNKTRVVLLAILILPIIAMGKGSGDFFVATDGNDGWSGARSTPNAAKTDGPFATLNAARVAVRQLREQSPMTQPVTVLVRGGTYFLPETLMFQPEDSGTTASPVVYAAYPGEKPILSGGMKLNGFQPDTRGRWHLVVPEVKAGDLSFLSLYVNGERRFRPRLPKSGSYLIANEVQLDPKDSRARPSSFQFIPGQFRSDWVNLRDVEVLTAHIWSMSRMRVKQVDTASNTVHFTSTTLEKDALWSRFYAGFPFLVENVKEALSEPGEWYLDRPTGELTYIPRNGEAIDSAVVIAPRLEQIMRLNGDAKSGHIVSHLVFKGLTFAHSNWYTPEAGYHFPQSDATVPGAIVAEGAQDCRFEDCSIEHTGGYGLQFGDGCKCDVVDKCELKDLGAGGIKLGFWARLQPESATTSDNIIRNNLIAHGGRVHPGGTGIVVGASHGNRIEHNTIFDLYYMGISLGYTWEENTTARDNIVADNHIFGLGQGFLSDMGAIYTLGLSPGTLIRHNLIHDVLSRWYGGWALYLDALSSEVQIEDNIVYRTDAGALHPNRGQGNRVTNNIFALGTEAQLTRSGPHKLPTFDFERNIVYWKNAFLLSSNWKEGSFDMDHNLYWDATGRPVKFGTLTLEQWRGKGHDVHSVIADPLFADPDDGDFRLADNSPALKLGFKPIANDGFGREGHNDKILKYAPKAYPDLSRQLPLKFDFEDVALGARPPLAVVEGEGGAASVRVTDETAAGGKHSLKFVDDGKRGAPYLPFISYTYKCVDGIVIADTSVKMTTGSTLVYEWRDIVNAETPGPSLTIGTTCTLIANGRELRKVPLDRWIKLRTVCQVGPRAKGTYDLTVDVEGEGGPRTFHGLKYDPGFERLMGLFYLADEPGAGTFYLDDISIVTRDGF